MRVAQILYNKVHWIFEAEEIPSYPPDSEGNPIILIDISNFPDAKEGFGYNPLINTIVPIPNFPQKEGYRLEVVYDEDVYEFRPVYYEIEQQ